MKDLTYIKVKQGKLLASDMVKPDLSKSLSLAEYKRSMESFNKSFVEVGNPDFLRERLSGTLVEQAIHPVSGLQFEVKYEHLIDMWWFTLSEHGIMNKYKENDPEYRKVAILSLKQEQKECNPLAELINRIINSYKIRVGKTGSITEREMKLIETCIQECKQIAKQEQPSEEKENLYKQLKDWLIEAMPNGKVTKDDGQYFAIDNSKRFVAYNHDVKFGKTWFGIREDGSTRTVFNGVVETLDDAKRIWQLTI